MSKSKALELKQKLQKLPKNWPQNEDRVLIREGLLFVEEDHTLKPRWCFLFNDCFLECKPACEFADNFSRLADPNTPYRYKHYIMLNTCYIEENPNIIKKQSNQQHKATPFILVGHNLESPRTKKTEHQLIFSPLAPPERELWCSDIHSSICKIHTSMNNDHMNYGWQNQYRKGLIYHAVYTLHNELVKQLATKLEISEKLKDIAGHNLLHLAMAVNNVDFIDEYGASIDSDDTDINGWSALRIGCDNDSVDAVRQLTEELYPNLDEYYPSDRTVNPTKVKQQQQFDDRTILHEICNRGQSQLVEILLATEQINMEALDKEGSTPLHVASKKNQEQCVIFLLQNGAPPNLADFKGNRPLHLTTKDMVARWLVAYGARLELENHAKKSCRDVWKNRLEKYVAFGQTLSATDCRIQKNMAETNAWFDDKLSNACLLCGCGFTVFSRRHHCRVCGLLVCQACSSRKLQFCGKDNKQCLERACDKCFNKNHTKLLRKKEYSYLEEKVYMKPKDFYKMCVMETTLKGSYNIYMKAFEEKENDLVMIDENQMKNEGANNKDNKENEEQKQNKKHHKHRNKNDKHSHRNTKQTNKSHKISRSLGFLNKNKKNDNKNIRFAKHETAQSEATFQAHEAINKVNERGEKLSELQDKSDKMADAAKNFNDLAKQLANKKW